MKTRNIQLVEEIEGAALLDQAAASVGMSVQNYLRGLASGEVDVQPRPFGYPRVTVLPVNLPRRVQGRRKNLKPGPTKRGTK